MPAAGKAQIFIKVSSNLKSINAPLAKTTVRELWKKK